MKKRRSARLSKASGGFWLDSMSAVREFCWHRPEALLSVECHPRHQELLTRLLNDCGLDPNMLRLSKKLDVLAQVKLKTMPFSRMLAANPDLILALDHITDPRNLGAVVRSAAFFGCRYVLVPTKRQVLLTQAVVATAMGGFALTELVAVSSLAASIADLKEHGWSVFGAEMSGRDARVIKAPSKVVIALGSEERGLSQSVQAACDQFVAVCGVEPHVESLNVAVAAGVLLSTFAALTRS